jgi:C-terminal processing protease CtpA/Prc
MKKIFLMFVLLVMVSVNIFAQTEEKRIERLSGLAKVWGTVKYFHPFLAYREIDWDKALIETIPKVNAAKSSQEYAAAINSMLAALNDKSTRADVTTEKPKAAENQTPTVAGKEPFRLENGVLMIDGYATTAALVGANNLANEFIAKTNQLVPQAKAVEIDLRFPPEQSDEFSYFIDYYFESILPAILDKNVALSTLRYRMHNGYESQGSSGSGGYYSALVTTAPQTIGGNNKAKTPPIVFIVNENSPLTKMLAGLQAANMAFVVQDGDSSEETGAATTNIKLPDNVVVKMRTAELVNADGTIGFAADFIAPKGEAMREAQRIVAENKFVSGRAKTVSANASQVSQKEKTYAEMEFPNAEYRLLALFRFWNVISYFAPYKDLIGTDWDTILPKYIPQFEADKDALEYRITASQMVAEIHDSHGAFIAPPLKNPVVYYLPPFVEDYAENLLFVHAVLDESSGFKVGDVILEADGAPVEKLEQIYAARIAASTPQASMRAVKNRGIFRGEKDSKISFKVRGMDGATREIQTTRSVAASDPAIAKYFQSVNKRQTPVVSVLPSGFGYVDLARLTLDEVDKMFETIKGTPAVIFDMRGYPNGTAWAIAPRLTTKKSPVAALFSNPLLEAVNLSDGELASASYTFGQKLPEAKGDIYTGKVVMLINENAISQSEHTALFFETARPEITFIGTPTNGANGDVTSGILPGNIRFNFSGHGVRHADGRQLQRIGIQPTIKVAPTIRGIVEGKDEILDAAIDFLKSNR